MYHKTFFGQVQKNKNPISITYTTVLYRVLPWSIRTTGFVFIYFHIYPVAKLLNPWKLLQQVTMKVSNLPHLIALLLLVPAIITSSIVGTVDSLDLATTVGNTGSNKNERILKKPKDAKRKRSRRGRKKIPVHATQRPYITRSSTTRRSF